MRTLFHQPFDPSSRFIALILAEKQLEARFETPYAGDGAESFAAVNPALTIPALVDDAPTGGEIMVAPESAIAEYLDEAYPDAPLMPSTSAGRAETRRLLAWVSHNFDMDVNAVLLKPRIETNGRYVFETQERRVGLNALQWHLDYFNWLLERRNWIAGEKMTLADFALAAHLSIIDYFGEIDWNADGGKTFSDVRNWFARMKCRPSFRDILKEKFANIPPALHYQNPDF